MDSIFNIVASVLNLGNIQFSNSEAKNDKSPAQLEGKTSQTALNAVAAGLGVTPKDLAQCLLNKKMQSRKEVFWSPQPASVANNIRDGLAKVRVFACVHVVGLLCLSQHCLV
jgi:myosin heavy subunit